MRTSRSLGPILNRVHNPVIRWMLRKIRKPQIRAPKASEHRANPADRIPEVPNRDPDTGFYLHAGPNSCFVVGALLSEVGAVLGLGETDVEFSVGGLDVEGAVKV